MFWQTKEKLTVSLWCTKFQGPFFRINFTFYIINECHCWHWVSAFCIGGGFAELGIDHSIRCTRFDANLNTITPREFKWQFKTSIDINLNYFCLNILQISSLSLQRKLYNDSLGVTAMFEIPTSNRIKTTTCRSLNRFSTALLVFALWEHHWNKQKPHPVTGRYGSVILAVTLTVRSLGLLEVEEVCCPFKEGFK